MRTNEYVVVYDISDDKERRKIDKLLKGFGFRIQKSVFECLLNESGKNELIIKLNALQLRSGFARIYRLEKSFGVKNIGQNKEGPDDQSAYIV